MDNRMKSYNIRWVKGGINQTILKMIDTCPSDHPYRYIRFHKGLFFKIINGEVGGLHFYQVGSYYENTF